jgi:hypothetical protein
MVATFLAIKLARLKTVGEYNRSDENANM